MANPTTYFGWVMPNSADLVTDLPADFNVFGQGVDTSMQYLIGGTTGQVLSKTSATNMAFTWVTPTDQTPLTTKGDLFTFTTVDARLGVGSNNQTLYADSTAPTGLAWGASAKSTLTTTGDIIYASAANTPARLGIGSASQVLSVSGGIPAWTTPASGGMTLLSTTTLSGSTVTVSSISGSYTDLQIIVKGAYSSADADLFVRLNGDTGSNYSYFNMGISDTSASNAYSDSATSAQIGYIGSSTGFNQKTNISIDFPRYTDTSNCFGISTLSTYSFSGRRQVQSFFRNNNSAAITSFTIFPASGTFTAGTLYIYGVI